MDVSDLSLAMSAAECGDIGTLSSFIREGFDINSSDERGRTVLMAAAASGNVLSLKWLLEKGADREMAGNDGSNALVIARHNNNEAAAKILRDYYPGRVKTREPLSKKVPVAIFLIIAAALAAFYFFSGAGGVGEKEELEAIISAGDPAKLNQFIKDNYMLPAKRLLVEQAIETAMKKDMTASIQYLEYMFFAKKPFRENYSLIIIDSLNRKNAVFNKLEGSYERLFDEFVENIFSEKLSSAMKVMIVKIIGGGYDFESYFYSRMHSALKSRDVIAALRLLTAFINIEKSDAGLENILNMLSDLEPDERLIDDARKKIRAEEEAAANTRTFVDSLKHGRRLEISGYIVKKLGAYEYEFEFVKGDHPGKHAVMVMNKTGLKDGERFEVKAVNFNKKNIFSGRPLIESEWQYYINCPDSGTDKMVSDAEEKMRVHNEAMAAQKEELTALQKQHSENDTAKEAVFALINELIETFDRKKFERVISAIKSDEIEAIKKAISETSSVSDVLNLKDETGWTALMYAAGSGRSESVSLILNYPVDINAESAGQNAFMIARKKGYDDIAEILRKRGAVEIKELVIPVAIVKPPAGSGNDIDISEKIKIQLIEAVSGNKADNVRLLLNSGARAESKLENGDTVLMIAAKNGFHEIIKALLEKGADANFKNNKNHTPLTYALVSGDEKTVSILREAGAWLDEKTLNANLWESIKNNNIENVKTLVFNGANVNACDPGDNSTPLIYSAGSGDMRMLKFIAEKGGGLEMKTIEGWTALMKAVIKNRPEAAAYLLEQKVDIEATDNDGNTAFLLACQSGRADIVDMLVKKGAAIGKVNNKGTGAIEYVEKFPWLSAVFKRGSEKSSGAPAAESSAVRSNTFSPPAGNAASPKAPIFESNASKTSSDTSRTSVSDEEKRALEKINRSLKK